MSDTFNPYLQWLGIRDAGGSPNLYRLLGIELYETDSKVINGASDRQMAHLRTFQTGKRAKLCQKLLSEVSTARILLLNEEKKAVYDKRLRTKLGSLTSKNRPAPLDASLDSSHRQSLSTESSPSALPMKISGESIRRSSVASRSGRSNGSSSAVVGTVVTGATILALVGVISLAGGFSSNDTAENSSDKKSGDGQKDSDQRDVSLQSGGTNNRADTRGGRDAKRTNQADQQATNDKEITVRIANGKGNDSNKKNRRRLSGSVDKQVTDVRKLLAGRDVKAANELLVRIGNGPRTMTFKQKFSIDTIRAMAGHVTSFWKAVRTAASAMKAGETISAGTETMSFESFSDDLLLMTTAGKRHSYLIGPDTLLKDSDPIPARLAEALARQSLAEDSEELVVCVAAFYAMDQAGDLETAAGICRWAVEQKIDCQAIVAELEERNVKIENTTQPISLLDHVESKETDVEAGVDIPIKRSPVPTAKKRQATLREIIKVFEKEYADARLSKKVKLTLATMLLADAMETDTEPMRYVLFSEALRFAEQGGNLQQAMRIVDTLSTQYKVDELDLALTTLHNLSTQVSTTDVMYLVDQFLQRVDELARLNRYEEANKHLSRLKLRDKNAIRQISLKRTRLRAKEKQWTKAVAAAKSLKTDPDNPKHNLTVGRYYSLIVGDWRRGLPRLAKSSKEEWQVPAQAELKNPSNPAEKVTIAEAWKSLATSLKGDERRVLLERAKMWLERAEIDLKGIAKRNITKQIGTIDSLLAAKVGKTGKTKTIRAGPLVTIRLSQKVVMKFRQLPAGTFLYGPKKIETKIEKPFYMGIAEVTQGQWDTVSRSFGRFGRFNTDPSKFTGSPLLPVNSIDWDRTQLFIRAINGIRSVRGKYRFRLPTDEEWEYACRAGTKTDFFFGSKADKAIDYGWHKNNAGGKPHPVGMKRPNPWGLYDMTGNVLEWTQDKTLRGSNFESGTDGAATVFQLDSDNENAADDAESTRGFRVIVEQVK